MREESTPFRVIVSGVEVVETCFPIIIVAAVADGIVVCEVGVCAIRNLAVSVSIVGVLCLLYTVCVVDCYHVTVEITDVEIILRSSTVVGISYTDHTFVIVKVDELMGVCCCFALEGLGTVLPDKPAAAIIPIICFIGGVRAAKNYGLRVVDIIFCRPLTVGIVCKITVFVIAGGKPRVALFFIIPQSAGEINSFAAGGVQILVGFCDFLLRFWAGWRREKAAY